MHASATVTLSSLVWSTPDGRQLFRDLNLSFSAERAGLVGRNGVGKSSLLRLMAGDMLPRAGAVRIEGSLGTLRQVLQVDPDETIADLFGVRDALALLARADHGSASIDEIASADWLLPTRIAAALGRVGLSVEPSRRLAALSGGQRTRAAIAALMFGEPDFILLDEPTNNLDRQGREAVIELLRSWRGGAIVVSHDRELLDSMDAIVELTSLGATRHGGNWSHYRARKVLELASAQHDLAVAEKRIAEIARSTQFTAERKARKDGAGKRKGAKGDMPAIVLGLRKNRSEGTSGSSARFAERRRTVAAEVAAAARERIEILQPFSVVLAPTGLAAGKTVLAIQDACIGYTPDHPVIRDLSFSITGPERVALIGPNGSGKSTLLAAICGRLQTLSGSVRTMTDFAFLDQRVELLDETLSIRDNYLRINPGAGDNGCRAALASFMFRADAALQKVGTLSGGQRLRAGLACVLAGPTPPPLLILDEPTNHLEIDAIEAVEAALRAYDGALLVVSHDEAFLESIGLQRRLCL